VPDETVFVNALNGLGYLFDDWNAQSVGVTPAFADVNGYDVMIWETGIVSANPVSIADTSILERYLSAGGTLYLNSMDLFNVSGLPSDFTRNYLGIASYTYNTKARTENGVSGDPITSGMVLPLDWHGLINQNRVSTLNPDASAAAILYSETNHPNAVRFDGSGFRTVCSSVFQNVISDTDADPNNNKYLIGRIIAWLLGGVSSVPSQPAAGVTRILAAQPNPFSHGTDLSFNLSAHAAGSPVRLNLVDAAGRAVRTLVDGNLAVGSHTIGWNGKDDSGRPAPSGVYFARLQSRDRATTQKLILIE
jgi:hypothetical protein